MRLLLAGLGFGLTPVLYAQPTTVTGRVTDALNGQPLEGVSVLVLGTKTGVATDADGRYRVDRLPASAFALRFSHVGYETAEVALETGRTTYDITLTLATTMLGEITVDAESMKEQLRRAQVGLHSMPARTLATLPSVGATRDVLRALQFLPGFRSNNDLSVGYHVRGGLPSENLILLNGIPIYNSWHLFGFFSAFNADALENVHLMKGAFPAEYGGRLSSVLALDMKEGPSEGAEGKVTVSLVAAEAMARGASRQGRLRWMLAGRRSYLDPLLWLFTLPARQGASKAKLGYAMGDLNAKILYDATPRLQVAASLFAGLDRLDALTGDPVETLPNAPLNEDWGDYGWRTAAARIAARQTVSERFITTFSGYVTRHTFGIGTGYVKHRDEELTDSLDYSYRVRFNDWNIKLSNDWLLDDHLLRFGGEVTVHDFSDAVRLDFNVNNADLQQVAGRLDSLVQSQPSIEAGLFVQDRWDVTPRLQVRPSVRWSLFRARGDSSVSYTALEPRFDARLLLSEALTLKAGAATTRQYLHQVADELLILPFDRWFPAQASVPPQRALQGALGLEMILRERYLLDVEFYYRRLHGLIQFSPYEERIVRDGLQIDDPEFQELDSRTQAGVLTRFGPLHRAFVFGKGESYGAEVFLERRAGRLTGMLSYTLSWTYQRFDELNRGRTFPAFHDRRHDLAISAAYPLGPRLHLAGGWTYQTGAPFNLPIGYYSFYGHPAETPVQQRAQFTDDVPSWRQYGPRNSYRLPSYHRLDVVLTWQSRFLRSLNGEGGLWSFSIYNLYSRINPIALVAEDGKQGTNGEPSRPPRLLKLGVLPIVPSFSVTFKF